MCLRTLKFRSLASFRFDRLLASNLPADLFAVRTPITLLIRHPLLVNSNRPVSRILRVSWRSLVCHQPVEITATGGCSVYQNKCLSLANQRDVSQSFTTYLPAAGRPMLDQQTVRRESSEWPEKAFRQENHQTRSEDQAGVPRLVLDRPGSVDLQ